MTRNSPIFAKSVMSSSVMPSTKYSCCGSLERFNSGRMAIERIGESEPPARTRRPIPHANTATASRSEEHTSELQSYSDLVCRLLLEKKKPARPQPSERVLALLLVRPDDLRLLDDVAFHRLPELRFGGRVADGTLGLERIELDELPEP